MLLDAETQDLLAAGAVAVDAAVSERLEALCATLRRFNPLMSLVSSGDLAALWERHVVDSLSLAPYAAGHIASGGLVDIGSGGGFPGLVLAACWPAAPAVLIERSDAKAGYLENACVAMGLGSVRVVRESYPGPSTAIPPGALVTARAVEKMPRVVEAVLGRLPAGARFLCQHPAGADADPGLFHVEQIEDAWSASGRRRGVLYLVDRRIP